MAPAAAGEPTTTTDDTGAFVLADAGGWPLVADISTHATINGHAVGRHLVLRAPADLRSRRWSSLRCPLKSSG